MECQYVVRVDFIEDKVYQPVKLIVFVCIHPSNVIYFGVKER